MAGLYYWFPKMTGRMLSEGLGKLSFWLMVIGFNLTFLPQYSAGLSGMPRRVVRVPRRAGLEGYNLVSTIGSFVLALGVLVTVVNVVWAMRKGRRAGPDPWRANTLEWFTPSPPPAHNFDVIPTVRSLEPMKDIRRARRRSARRRWRRSRTAAPEPAAPSRRDRSRDRSSAVTDRAPAFAGSPT